jgi:hypothetical protein
MWYGIAMRYGFLFLNANNFNNWRFRPGKGMQ